VSGDAFSRLNTVRVPRLGDLPLLPAELQDWRSDVNPAGETKNKSMKKTSTLAGAIAFTFLLATGISQSKAQQSGMPASHDRISDKDRAKKSAEIIGAGKNPDTSIDPATVTYTPHKWDLPIVQSVLILTKFATEAGMIAVARRIDRDALDYQTVDVEIFDNEKAERLSRLEILRRELTKSEDAFCKLHTLAVYR